MPFTTPPTAVHATAIASAHVNILRDNDNWFNALLGTPTLAGQVPIALGTASATYGFVGTASIVDSALTSAKITNLSIGSSHIADGNVDTTALATEVTSKLLAVGVGGWFRTAAEIPSGWSRETNLDGRFAVGAGTTFSVTYVEATNYGSSWAHSHGVSTSDGASFATGSPNTDQANFTGSGGFDSAHGSHVQPTTGASTDSTTWAIPSRAYVAARRS